MEAGSCEIEALAPDFRGVYFSILPHVVIFRLHISPTVALNYITEF